jgi:iron complex transport system ATP-binding protein
LQGAGILLLDEPLANLDLKYQIELLRLLNHLRQKKSISIVMALHDINMALQFKRVILLKKGTILGIGNPDETLTEANLRDAFDLDISVKRDAAGRASIGYEPHFFQETVI